MTATTPSTQQDSAQQAALEARIPKNGIFNGVTIPAISGASFGAVGYFLGKKIGEMADEKENIAKFNFGFATKWIGAISMGLMAVSVAIRHHRESKQQALNLAKQTIDLEQRNQALEAALSKPVGTLVEPAEQLDSSDASSVDKATDKGVVVSDIHHEGMQSAAEKRIAI
jgi:hypothetical protein